MLHTFIKTAIVWLDLDSASSFQCGFALTLNVKPAPVFLDNAAIYMSTRYDILCLYEEYKA